MRMLDEQAVALVGRALDDVKRGVLAVESYEVEDTDSLVVRLVFVAGQRAVADERERRMAAAGMASAAPPNVGASAPRSPTSHDVCPSCGKVGGLRDAGALAWLCIACNAETSPFGAGG